MLLGWANIEMCCQNISETESIHHSQSQSKQTTIPTRNHTCGQFKDELCHCVTAEKQKHVARKGETLQKITDHNISLMIMRGPAGPQKEDVINDGQTRNKPTFLIL